MFATELEAQQDGVIYDQARRLKAAAQLTKMQANRIEELDRKHRRGVQRELHLDAALEVAQREIADLKEQKETREMMLKKLGNDELEEAKREIKCLTEEYQQEYDIAERRLAVIKELRDKAAGLAVQLEAAQAVNRDLWARINNAKAALDWKEQVVG